MHFASVFYELLDLSTPIPLTLFCDSRKNFSSNEIPTEIEQLIKYYDYNTSLKADYIKNYLQNNCAEIISNLRFEHIINDLHDLFLPRKVQELINSSFQLSEPESTGDIEVVGDN